MENKEIECAIEALLFAAGDPVPMPRIAKVLGVEVEQIELAAKQLADAYNFDQRGIRLVRLGEKLQLCSAPEYALYVTRILEQRRPPRLSQTALEVLAIVAYYQPVTRAYIDQVRGVDSSYTVGLLTERGLIETCGKLEVPGRPSIYRTTDLFLRTMGIQELSELPPLPDLTTDEGVEKLQNAIEELKQEKADPPRSETEV
jgi:segregation and condensation protein B